MDKGLEKINELEQKLEELEIQLVEIQKYEIDPYTEKGRVERENKLQEDKEAIDNFKPIDIKKLQSSERKYDRIIKVGYILAYVPSIFFLIILLAGISGSLDLASLKLHSRTLHGAFLIPTVIGATTMAVITPKLYSIKNKIIKYKPLEELEKKYKFDKKEYEKYIQRGKKMQSPNFDILQEKRKTKEEISTVKKQIEQIKKMRNEVIQEYLKNNPELDSIINTQYEESIEQIHKHK